MFSLTRLFFSASWIHCSFFFKPGTEITDWSVLWIALHEMFLLQHTNRTLWSSWYGFTFGTSSPCTNTFKPVRCTRLCRRWRSSRPWRGWPSCSSSSSVPGSPCPGSGRTRAAWCCCCCCCCSSAAAAAAARWRRPRQWGRGCQGGSGRSWKMCEHFGCYDIFINFRHLSDHTFRCPLPSPNSQFFTWS